MPSKIIVIGCPSTLSRQETDFKRTLLKNNIPIDNLMFFDSAIIYKKLVEDLNKKLEDLAKKERELSEKEKLLKEKKSLKEEKNC